MKTNVRHHLRRTHKSGVVPVIRHQRGVHQRDKSELDAMKRMGEEKFLETKLLKQLRATAYHPDKRYEELISQGYSEEDSEAIVTGETDTYEEYEKAKQLTRKDGEDRPFY